jgi:hypothetical protein
MHVQIHVFIHEFVCVGDREVHTGFWWGDLREKYNLEDLGLDWRMILKWVFKECDGEAWTGQICLRVEVSFQT